MTIPFSNVPQTLVPGPYIEIQAQRLSSPGEFVRPTVLTGQMTSTGTATENTAYLVSSSAQGRTLFGRGSCASHMIDAYLKNNPNSSVYCIGIDDAVGTAATGTLQVTHAATGAGSIFLYVGGRRVVVAVGSSDTVDTIAAAIEAACDALPDLPVVASSATDTVTFTAVHKGTVGNGIDLRVNYRGANGGEELPAGVTLTIVAMGAVVAGATDPTLDATTGLHADEYDFIVPWICTDTNLDNWQEVVAEYWLTVDQRMPYVIAGTTDTNANQLTLGGLRNAPHETVMGLPKSPTPGYEIAAALAGVATRVLSLKPYSGLTGIPLVGVLAPASADRLTWAERSALLDAGIATCTVGNDGTVYIERERATYKTDSSGAPDGAWLDMQRSTRARRIVRRCKARINRDFFSSGMVIVDDNRTVSAGEDAVSTSTVKGSLVAEASSMYDDKLIVDLEAFKSGIAVEQDGTDQNRINLYLPINQTAALRIIAAVANFVG